MAHFAKLDENNIVIDINVLSNNVLDPLDEENSGISFLTAWSGGYTKWKQTSFNSNFRGTFAGIGYVYNEEEDIFIEPKPFASWIRFGSFWHAPIDYPTDSKKYFWNEEIGNWVEALAE